MDDLHQRPVPLDPQLPAPPDHEATGGFATQALAAWGGGWPNCQPGKQTKVTAGGVSVNVRGEIARLVEFALRETRNTGYVLKQAQTGAYVCRPIGGTSTPSNHSWGLAIDLNWQENPFTTNPNAPRTITPAVVAIWKSVGFSWGGDWSGKKDFMHMEFNGSPAEAARRTAALTPPTRMAEGIDVSHWQGRMDWQTVKDAGIVFAWMKATGSGDTALYEDPQYPRNRAETRRVGLAAGPYHFYLDDVGGAEQARHFRRVAGPSAPGDLRAALDIEDPPKRPMHLTREICHALVQETAQQFGHLPTIYVGESLFARLPWLEDELAGCPLWIPNWSRRPTRRHAVWQWTDKRPIPGRDPVDGNRADTLAGVLLGHQEEDPLSEASDRIEKALASLTDRLDRVERRLLRQIQAEDGAVYLYDGTQRFWVQDETFRLALVDAFRFGAPEQWSRSGIEKIPLVGPEAPTA